MKRRNDKDASRNPAADADGGGRSRAFKVGAVTALVVLAALVAIWLWPSGAPEGMEDLPRSLRNISYDVVIGQKEAARDFARLLHPPPNVRMAACTQLFPHYLGLRYVEIANNVEGVRDQFKNARADYVVIDSTAVRRFKPRLNPLIAGEDPLPEAGLVYRRYLREEDKMISVYQRGVASLDLKREVPRDEAAATIARAREYLDQGYVEHARQLLLSVLETDPNSPTARWDLVKVYMIQGYFDGKSLDRAEDELIRYSYLVPDDPDIKSYLDTIHSLRVKHDAVWAGPKKDE